ncbi:uncharacterized protein LOC144344480 [Saccoglossus kowalevskii]
MGAKHRQQRKKASRVDTNGKGSTSEGDGRTLHDSVVCNYLVWLCVLCVVVMGAITVWNYNEDNDDIIDVDHLVPHFEDDNLEYILKYYNVTHSIDKIDRRSNLSLEEYLDVYDAKWPVLITDVVPTWPAFNWTKDFFVKNYGDDRITMKGVEGGLTTGESLALPLSLFVHHLHMSSPQVWTYLEDELFIPQRPELMKDIGKVVYLEEDYFQLFPQEVRPWNAMLLWGTEYSRSSLHIDPYNWTGTNAVLKGTKRWKLYPPGQDDFLYVFKDQRSGFPLDCYKYNSPIDTHDVNLKMYPKFKKAKAMEFDQHAGELLMIPSGWFHQAYNMEETMAISSQVMNNNNYKIVLHEIIKADNINKVKLPTHFNSMSPEQQVKTVMAILPDRVLARGKQVTQTILEQLKY